MHDGIVTYQPDNSLKKGYLLILKEIISELKDNRWLTYQLFKTKFMASYKQSFVGILWKFVSPLISVGTFILLNRSGVFNIGEIGVPYPLYALIGVSFWQIFATGLAAGSSSLVNAGTLIAKINFSKKSLVIAEIGQVLVTFIIQLILLVLLFLYYRTAPSWGALLIPLVIISLILFTIGLSFILSLFNSVMRDISSFLPIAINFLMFLTPVMYTKPKFGILSNATKYNPLYYMVSAGRDLVLTGTISELKGFIISAFVSICIFIVCISLFHLTETKVAERI